VVQTPGRDLKLFGQCRKNDESSASPRLIVPPRAKQLGHEMMRVVEGNMRTKHFALGISACLGLALAVAPAAADAGKTEAVYPSGASVAPMDDFVWLVSKNADKYDLEILDKNGVVLQTKTFTSAKAKCNQKKNLVCRARLGDAIDPKAASWRVRGVDGSKKGPLSELAYFVVDTDTPLWAVVNPDLTLARGAGVVSVGKDGEGRSAVVFDRDITNCAYTANVGYAGDNGAAPDGAVTVVGLGLEPKGVFISTYDQAGEAVDSGYHLVVTCGGTLPPN
jgi:hypothetical protein